MQCNMNFKIYGYCFAWTKATFTLSGANRYTHEQNMFDEC